MVRFMNDCQGHSAHLKSQAGDYCLVFSLCFQAREHGQAQCKWVIVNVQNVQEFSCQQLNRDVWSDSTVKSIIKESFVFWQVRTLSNIEEKNRVKK